MQTEYRQHGCGEYTGRSRGPELYYGYCHETGRMRMMDYAEYMRNVQMGCPMWYREPQCSRLCSR